MLKERQYEDLISMEVFKEEFERGAAPQSDAVRSGKSPDPGERWRQ